MYKWPWHLCNTKKGKTWVSGPNLITRLNDFKRSLSDEFLNVNKELSVTDTDRLSHSLTSTNKIYRHSVQ